MPRASPARDRLLRAILGGTIKGDERPPRRPSLYAISKQADVAFSWVHKTVHQLEALGFLSTARGIKVVDAAGAYRWWAQNRPRPVRHSFHILDQAGVAAKLRDAGIDLAATTYFAENLYSRHLFPRRFDAYIEPGRLLEARKKILELGGLLGGSNFRLVEGDAHLLDESRTWTEQMRRPDSGFLVAPLPQVVVDLIQEGGSASEAADILIARTYQPSRPAS